MKVWPSLLALCLLCITVRVQGYYTAALSNTTIELGDSVTVAWSGPCSHDDFFGCYDWVAPFQAGACVDGTDKNTCYLRNEWWWVSDQNNQLSFSFDGPGEYEFRFPYCGCKKCVPLLDDFSTCSQYDNYGTSPIVRVNPPFDLSPFSPDEQYQLGIIWVLFEGSMSAIKSLFSAPASGSCSNCFCEVKAFYRQASKLGDDFSIMVNGSYTDSLFEQMKTVVSDISAMVHTVADSITLCHIDAIIGKPVTKDLLASTAEWLTGLKAVTEFFEMIITGEKVFTDVSNIDSAWRLGNYFTSGVFTGRLVETVLQAVSGRSMAAAHAASASNQHKCMLRHPGGEWSPCSCNEPLNTARFPGNRCKPVSYYAALPPTRVD